MNKRESKIPNITFDVMLHERFVCTLHMPLSLKYLIGYENDTPIFNVPPSKELRNFVEQCRPSLKGKDYRIYLCTGKPKWRN